MLRHSMRAYYLPICAGFLLAGSAFMPWILIGDNALGGVPSISGFWVLVLAIIAVVLASLSVITRKNSRHPLLVVGLAAFAIVLLSEQWMQRSAVDQIWAQEQAVAIVQGEQAEIEIPATSMAGGGYLALVSSAIIILFGLTIVVRKTPSPYAVSENDDA
jgi:hypothetical protein